MSLASRRITAPLAIATMLLAGTTLSAEAATPAHATTQWIGGGTNVNIRVAPSVTATVARVVPNGASITIDCQTIGSKLGFSTYAENRTWDKLTDGTYIHDVVTDTPADQAKTPLADGGYVKYSSAIPRCGSTPPATLTQKAANNALSTVGHAYAQDTGMNFFSAGDWSPGPNGEWSYDCVKLVMASYIKEGQRPKTASTATGVWQAYGSPRRTDTPPAGAFIFFPGINHITISIGGGQMVSTMGHYDGDEENNAQLPVFGSIYGSPTGWAMPF